MRHENGQVAEQLQHEIPIGDGVEAVFGHAAQAELLGDELPGRADSRFRPARRAQRGDHGALAALGEALAVAQQHLRVAIQVVRSVTGWARCRWV